MAIMESKILFESSLKLSPRRPNFSLTVYSNKIVQLVTKCLKKENKLALFADETTELLKRLLFHSASFRFERHPDRPIYVSFYPEFVTIKLQHHDSITLNEKELKFLLHHRENLQFLETYEEEPMELGIN